MVKKYIAFVLVASVSITFLKAGGIVDCRVMTSVTTECNPYGSRLIRAKEVLYDIDKQKLIVSKTLPIPSKKPEIRIISVADMIEKHVTVEDSMRYRGSYNIMIPSAEKREENLSREEILQHRRQKNFERLEQLKQEALQKQRLAEEKQQSAIAEKKRDQGFYTIAKGDTLSTIAFKYGMKTKDLKALNQIGQEEKIRIGKRLLLPFPQETVNAIALGEYKVQSDDTLISVARKFNFAPRKVAQFNDLKTTAILRVGKTIQLPFPYRIKALEAKKKKAAAAKKKHVNVAKKRKRLRLIHGFGKHKLRVTATAYSSHRGQTDKTPFLAAWNNHIRPGMKIIAVSRDLLSKYRLRNGSRVRIGGLPGIYRVRDKMNKRFRKRIDIYMGTSRRRALRWGRRSVVLYW